MKVIIISGIRNEVMIINIKNRLLCLLTAVTVISSLFIFILPNYGSAIPYSTPNTGLSLTMDNLVAISGGTVTGSNPNYEVHDNVTISETDKLMISAGETISFNKDCGVYIDGTLIAVGTEEEMITFTSGQSSPSGGDWRGVVFSDKSVDEECIVKFCRIEYASNGIHIAFSSPTISNNIIANNGDDKNRDNGIFCQNGQPLIMDNEIADNIGDGIHCYSAAATIINNTITYNSVEGIYLDSLANALVDDNTISNNSRCGIRAYHSSPTIINNYITLNRQGIQCYRPSTPILTNNTIVKNEVGISLGNDTSPIITQNIIEKCDKAVFGWWHTNGTLVNCTISESIFFDFMITDNSHLVTMGTIFDKTRMYFGDSLSTLTVNWYIDVIVTADNVPISNASINISDSQDNEIYNGFTYPNGYIGGIVCIECLINSTTTTYFTPHQIGVTKNGYEPISKKQVTIDKNREINIQLEKSSQQPNDGTQNGISEGNNDFILIVGIIAIIIAVFVGVFFGRKIKVEKVEAKKSKKKVKGRRQSKKKRR